MEVRNKYPCILATQISKFSMYKIMCDFMHHCLEEKGVISNFKEISASLELGSITC
jgi:hypothetical protein